MSEEKIFCPHCHANTVQAFGQAQRAMNVAHDALEVGMYCTSCPGVSMLRITNVEENCAVTVSKAVPEDYPRLGLEV